MQTDTTTLPGITQATEMTLAQAHELGKLAITKTEDGAQLLNFYDIPAMTADEARPLAGAGRFKDLTVCKFPGASGRYRPAVEELRVNLDGYKDEADAYNADPEGFPTFIQAAMNWGESAREPDKPEPDGAATETQEWEPPVPFTDYNLPPFPVDSLPTWVKSFVVAEAETTQTPLDLAGMLALAVCAAALAKKVKVFVREDWAEPVNLFSVTVLPPGSRKSQVFADTTEPVNEYERELARAMLPEIEATKSKRKIMESALADKQSRAAKETDSTRQEKITREAADLARELSGFQVDAPPRLVFDDCSTEKLGSHLAEQGGKAAVMSPEGDIFDILAGRYSSGAPNFGVFLKGHAGDNLRVDRVGRQSEYVQDPALTVALTVQPEVMRGLIQKPGFRGRGLLARFLFTLPLSIIGRRKINPVPMSMQVRTAYRQNIRAFLTMAAGTNDNGEPAAYALRLDPKAQREFEHFREENEPQLAEHGELGMIQDWGSKLPGAVARMAGILHLAENVEQRAPWTIQISGQTMRKAIDLGRYLIPHAQAAFNEMGADPEIDAARYLLDWMITRGITKTSKRDLFQGTKGRFKRVKALDPALTILEERGFIRQAKADKEGPGRKPSPIYELNPYSHNSHNSQNTPGKPYCENTGNCERGAGHGKDALRESPDDLEGEVLI